MFELCSSLARDILMEMTWGPLWNTCPCQVARPDLKVYFIGNSSAGVEALAISGGVCACLRSSRRLVR
eukprot:11458175-Alexandrium_andersonii.AAC.1